MGARKEAAAVIGATNTFYDPSLSHTIFINFISFHYTRSQQLCIKELITRRHPVANPVPPGIAPSFILRGVVLGWASRLSCTPLPDVQNEGEVTRPGSKAQR